MTAPPLPPLPVLPIGFSWTRRAERPDSVRLVLAGELDLAARPIFEAALGGAQTDSYRVLLDLGALTLIDCASLRVVFAAAARSRGEGAVLILLSMRGQVRRLIDLVGAPRGVVILEQEDLSALAAGVAA